MDRNQAPRRVALYARVSTDEQTTDNQIDELRRMAAARAWGTVTAAYAERMTGKAEERPALRQMLRDAHARRFDVLLFWSLDRLSRAGIRPTLEILEALERAGIEYYSAQEPEISNAGALGAAFVAIRSTFAALELERIRERTRAGVARARAEGKTIGRPRRVLDAGRMADMRAAGASLRDIAGSFDTDPMTVARRLRGREPQLATAKASEGPRAEVAPADLQSPT